MIALPLSNESEARPWKRAMGWLAFLGPFFFLSYGLSNAWTSRLSNVSSMVFEWEKQIPFLGWTILPYMSIDAFYAFSLFLCTTRTELDTHAKRLLSATLISITGFLLFPLKFSFIRPPTTGFNGALFDALTSFDQPFNQAPSLHISLLMVLWAKYALHLRGMARWVMHVWFMLIGLSVFTTYQHHVIDGITGVVVGIFCFYLFPDYATDYSEASPTSIAMLNVAHRKLQKYYLVSAAIFFVLGYYIQGWAWFLLWPASALLLVSFAYAHFGTRVFQKHQGQLSWAAHLLLLPYQLGAWCSSRWFTRYGPPHAEVVPGIWIGRAPGQSDFTHLKPQGILDLTAEFNASKQALSCHYRSVPMLDLVVPSLQQLAHAVDALDELYPYTPVLVHCALGYSRSALVMAAWLLHRRLALTPKEAIDQVRAARPQIVFSPMYQATLEAYEHAYVARN